MEDQPIKGKNYTVGALILHTAVLFFFDSFSLGGSIFFVWGFLAIAVTGAHYRDTLKREYLQLWGIAHIAISIYLLIEILSLSGLSPFFYQESLLMLVAFITPPIAIIIFATTEGT
ncbi:MAG: hypothetical protein ACFFFK_07960 [Candidatus Thorarchaeota archaeon]